jgi:hypothetical protein
MNDPPRVHICLGGIQQHLDELEHCEAGRYSTRWTINKSALSGDRVAFYMRQPWSAFVATGTVHDQSQLQDDKSSAWNRHYMSDISKEAQASRSASPVKRLYGGRPIRSVKTRLPRIATSLQRGARRSRYLTSSSSMNRS